MTTRKKTKYNKLPKFIFPYKYYLSCCEIASGIMSNEGNDDLLGNIQNGLYSDGSIKVYMQLHLQITKTPTNKTQ